MTNFQKIIKSLRAYYVIIVENDFQYIENAEEIVGRFLLLKRWSQSQLISDLNDVGLKNLSTSINNLKETFDGLDHNENLKDALMPNDLNEYLRNIDSGDIALNTIKEVAKTLELDSEFTFREICLRQGIFLFDGAAYRSIFSELSAIEEVQVSYYKSAPTSKSEIEFTERLIQGIKDTNSAFYLPIVDKMLGEGAIDEQGREFIESTLIPINDQRNLRFTGFVLTSDEKDKEPQKYEDYFLREISKTDSTLISTIVNRLAQAAYAEVFKGFENRYIQGSSRALETVLKNQKNIKYIINKAHIEGIPAYDTIQYWYDLAVRMALDNQENSDFHFFGGLTAFMNDDYLEDHPEISTISPELIRLNSFELFDYSINHKHVPIAPGDIWLIGDQYYILMGQLCDLLLRIENNKRNSKVAELLPIKLEDFRDGPDVKKFQVKQGKTIRVLIEHFYEIDSNQPKTLNISVSTSSSILADFKVLDLSMFNEDGKAKISFSDPLNDNVKDVLPFTKESLYLELQSYFTELSAQKKSSYYRPLHLNCTDFQNSEQDIEFSVQRIARLKGRFYDSLYNIFLNTKSRVDLNLIDNSPEISDHVTLICQIADLEKYSYRITNVDLWYKRNERYFKRDSLISICPDFLIPLLNECDEKLTIGEKKQYDLIENDAQENTFVLTLRIKVSATKYMQKTTFSYKTLFQNQPIGKGIFQIKGDKEPISFLDEDGRPTRVINYDELERGIDFPEKNLMIKIESGIVKRTRLE